MESAFATLSFGLVCRHIEFVNVRVHQGFSHTTILAAGDPLSQDFWHMVLITIQRTSVKRGMWFSGFTKTPSW